MFTARLIRTITLSRRFHGGSRVKPTVGEKVTEDVDRTLVEIQFRASFVGI
jgi:hypothetical protein